MSATPLGGSRVLFLTTAVVSWRQCSDWPYWRGIRAFYWPVPRGGVIRRYKAWRPAPLVLKGFFPFLRCLHIVAKRLLFGVAAPFSFQHPWVQGCFPGFVFDWSGRPDRLDTSGLDRRSWPVGSLCFLLRGYCVDRLAAPADYVQCFRRTFSRAAAAAT